ncbi:MAG: ParB/RepB/Spo0J family partition protein [Oscillospiraceae bacterium]|nr:ParB/RepB/Spo0J family partition protein [Oscillospiraceae bacterium]MCX4256617.1 ParB/RepB/Spo0J family partition protein [Oscillospiraceae bacterium]
MAKKSLGMGLDALFGDNGAEGGDTHTLRISEIEPNRKQPRQDFDEAAIAELADSIRQHGLIQPIVVRPMEEGYQIVAGERRWRACRMLGMSDVPVVVKDFTDEETAQIALIENIQRQDLNPVEEAAAYRALMDEYGMTQEALSKAVGKSRSAIANSVRLLNLPDEIVEMLRKGKLSAGQAKAIASADSEDTMLEIAKLAADGKITVRGIEKLASERSDKDVETEGKQSVPKTAEERSSMSYITEMQISLEDHLQKKVKITSKDGEKGTIVIDFYSKDELADLADRLTCY